jgi:hypothetical protein
MKPTSAFLLSLIMLSACSTSFQEDNLIGAWHLKETRVVSLYDTTYTENYWTVLEFEKDSFFLHTNSTTEYISLEGKYSIKDSVVVFEWIDSSRDTSLRHSPITELSSQKLAFENDGITDIYQKIRVKEDYLIDPVSPPQIVQVDTTSSN